MLEKYFSAPKTLRRLWAGLSGPYIDGFAGWLTAQGYSQPTASTICVRRRISVNSSSCRTRDWATRLLDADDILSSPWHMPMPPIERRTPEPSSLLRRQVLLRLLDADGRLPLASSGECRSPRTRGRRGFRPLAAKAPWLFRLDHPTVPPLRGGYAQGSWRRSSPAAGGGIDNYFIERASRSGIGTAEKLVTNMRAVLRYMSVHGLCRAQLGNAVPAFAAWRLAELPRYLSEEQVGRVIAACDGGCRGGGAIAPLFFFCPAWVACR